MEYRYNSLEDFLVSHSLTVDGQADDGWGARFPVKGREIEATILFADITGFSRRTLGLSPTSTVTDPQIFQLVRLMPSEPGDESTDSHETEEAALRRARKPGGFKRAMSHHAGLLLDIARNS